MKKTLIAASLFALAGSAFAADGTIQFTGAFTDAPCEININGSTTNTTNSVSVALDTWNAANFKDNVGATTDLKPITISLSGCPNMTKANIQFNGATDAVNPTLFATQTGADTATNVGIALYSSANSADVITPNTRSLSIPLTAQTGQYTIYASYMTTGATVGQGAANADVTMDISYE
ncbi:fimbrial protein [Serratia oryzae]|uniref:fimbrial protein n=1 Tax=Serratia oryzae TaxID=2034155 RepID=UPI00130182DA|nr:fimbrial protein [Serratia oryzae]